MHNILFFCGFDNKDCGSLIIVDLIVFVDFRLWIIILNVDLKINISNFEVC